MKKRINIKNARRGGIRFEGEVEGIFVVDTDFRIMMLNEITASLVGLSVDEALGRRLSSVAEFVSEKEGISVEGWIRESVELGKFRVMPQPMSLAGKGRETMGVAGSATPMTDKAGDVIGSVIAFRFAPSALEIEKMKSDFVAVASHQLRTPLTPIKLFTEMLLDEAVGKINDEQKKYLNNVKNATEKMIDLIDEFLNFFRLESGELTFVPKETALEDFLEGVIFEIGQLHYKRDCDIILEKPEEPLPKVKVDQTLLHVAIRNIISNAIQYSRKDECHVVVTLGRDGNNCLISVKDSGIGIPQVERDKIFDKFFRGSDARKIDPEGSGLGLTVAKKVVEALGGRLWFDSKIGRGSTFYFSFPFLEERDDEEVLSQQESERVSQ